MKQPLQHSGGIPAIPRLRMDLHQQQPHRNISLIPPKHRRQLGDNVRHPVQFRGQLGYCSRKIKRL
jgi:hypothetical protein